MTAEEELQNLRRGFWWLYAGSRAPMQLEAHRVSGGGTISLENAKMEMRVPRSAGQLDFYGQFVFRRPTELGELVVSAGSVDEFDGKYVELGELVLECAWVSMQPVGVSAG